MKIATKINFTFITVFISLLVIAGIIISSITFNIFRQEIFNNLYYSGRAIAEHTRTFLDDQKKTGSILAGASVYRDFLKEPINSPQYKVIEKKIYDRLRRTIEVDDNIIEVFILDKNGKIIASTDPEQQGKDKSLDDYFINGQNNVFVKDVYFSETNNQINYTISVPIRDETDTNLLGVSVIRYNINTLNKNLSNYGESYQTKEAFLINKDRYFLTPSLFLGSSVVLSQIVDTKNTRDCFDQEEVDYVTKNGYAGLEKSVNKSQLVEAKDYRQIDVLAAHSFIPETNWCLITKINRSEFLTSFNSVGTTFIFASIIALIIFIFAAYWLSQKITQSISKLQNGMEIVAQGDLDYQVGTNSNDEIGQLSREFNNLTKSLKQSRANVDKKVEDQTKEIIQKAKDVENQQKAILNILEDVENSNNDLEKFKLAVDHASDHIIITDIDGIILYANESVENITGFSKDYVLGKKAGNKELWGGLMSLSFYKNLWKIIKTDKKVFSGEINNRRKNGQEYTAITSISPVLNNKNEIVYFVDIERDITHEKEVDRMKTEFISLASHQLRTPLSAMRWFSEMLLAGDAGKLNKDQEEFITNISLSNKRMISLVNSLLNISRIESGRLTINPKYTDLRILVKDTLSEINNDINDKKQTVTINTDKKLPKIKIDPKLISEVYKNILTNANKYTPVGGKISITIYKKGQEIISEISDTGYGIPVKDQPRVFEKFYRSENILKLETEGTGLGLYLAKAIVESSSGKIWFKSKENSGTTFWFTLPVSGVKPKKGEVAINS